MRRCSTSCTGRRRNGE